MKGISGQCKSPMGLLFPHIWAVGVPPNGFQGFGPIAGVYISLEFDRKNSETLGLGRGPAHNKR